jgi:hypothetical protein
MGKVDKKIDFLGCPHFGCTKKEQESGYTYQINRSRNSYCKIDIMDDVVCLDF